MSVTRVGTAGWAIPRRVADRFPSVGTGLQRYAARFDCAEINSTFYRPHQPATLERWAASVPAEFRFAVKTPKAITHELRLKHVQAPLAAFVEQIVSLGAKLGPVLVQLPPSLAFEAPVAEAFFQRLRDQFDGLVACEPRHSSWFEDEADALLARARVARVAADPACVPAAARPGGWPGLAYHRLHGSPRPYFSEYDDDRLDALARTAASTATSELWCIFDNTASGAAAANGLSLIERLDE